MKAKLPLRWKVNRRRRKSFFFFLVETVSAWIGCIYHLRLHLLIDAGNIDVNQRWQAAAEWKTQRRQQQQQQQIKGAQRGEEYKYSSSQMNGLRFGFYPSFFRKEVAPVNWPWLVRPTKPPGVDNQHGH